MENDLIGNSDFNDIVFRNRNREYGAYLLRKRYNRNVIISILIGIIIIVTVIIVPYLNARELQNRQRITERQVEIKLENLDEPAEQIAPPPPPPRHQLILFSSSDMSLLRSWIQLSRRKLISL